MLLNAWGITQENSLFIQLQKQNEMHHQKKSMSIVSNEEGVQYIRNQAEIHTLRGKGVSG